MSSRTLENKLEGLITKDDIANIAIIEGLVLEDDERISILESMRSIDVQACPGSGKTTLIATKLILLAKKWPLQYQGVCVLSHTNVAKNEIIERLKKSETVEAQRLLSYPHFIGTIQEFVNRFMALPYIRSKGVTEITVDNDEYLEASRHLLNLRQFGWLKGTLRGLGRIEAQDGFLRSTYRLFTENSAAIHMSKKPRAWQQDVNLQRAQQYLEQLKKYLDERGFYLFRDMYTNAQIACNSNEKLPKSIASRFPYVFVDEMQDTQKFQDDLLCNIFLRDNCNQIIQRFGDPDQAIFHGSGSDEPNDSFNGKSADEMDYLVHKSHRFDDFLAKKIKSFSFNEVPLETELPRESIVARSVAHYRGGNFDHTVIVYDDATCQNVIKTFSEIVSAQFSADRKTSNDFVVKAVGAVGNEITPNAGQLKLGHYWPEFKKRKSKSDFKEGTLIEAVRYCRNTTLTDFASNYNTLIDCILRLLRLANIRDDDGKFFSAASMKKFINSAGKWRAFRNSIYMMLNSEYYIDQIFWDGICSVLIDIFKFYDTPAVAAQYIAYTEEPALDVVLDVNDGDGDDSLIPLIDGGVRHPDGFLVELSTIHGVKGETHDATLVLETKNYCFDMGVMLPYVTEEMPTSLSPNSKLGNNAMSRRANKQFMRQFYVAMSRPKHLLCLAIHSERITDIQKQALKDLGWSLQELSPLTKGS